MHSVGRDLYAAKKCDKGLSAIRGRNKRSALASSSSPSHQWVECMLCLIKAGRKPILKDEASST